MSAERFQLVIVGFSSAGSMVALIATYIRPAVIPLYEVWMIERR